MNNEKIEIFKNEVDDFLEIVKFYNENFHKLQEKNRTNNELYFEHLASRFEILSKEYKKLLTEKEETLRG
jgi:hypothetical protein